MILCDRSIMNLCVTSAGKPLKYPMITPFVEGVQSGVISYGLTSSGYDMRLGETYLVYKNVDNSPVDPLLMKEDPEYAKRFLEERRAFKGIVSVPPMSYILGFSLEQFDIPKHLSGVCVGKSTYARCGIIINTTPLEPAWKGHLTIEIANHTPCPVHLRSGQGIAQVRFEMLDGEPMDDYESKGGKYQSQGPEPIAARVKS